MCLWRKKKGLPANYPAKRDPSADTGPGPEPKQLAPEAVKDPDGSGRKRTELDRKGYKGTKLDGSEPGEAGGDWPQGPVELHVELYGGWARIRAPGWEQAARLWRMLDVCISALSTEGGADG